MLSGIVSSPCPMPSDPWAAWIVAATWPEDAGIQSIIDCVTQWRTVEQQQHVRVDELTSAREAIIRSVQAGSDFEPMYAELARLISDRNVIAARLAAMVRYGSQMVEECYEAQHEQAAIGAHYGALAESAARAGDSWSARVAVQTGIDECWAKLVPRLEAFAQFNAIVVAMPHIRQSPGPSEPPPVPHRSGQAVDFKLDGVRGGGDPVAPSRDGAAASGSASAVGTTADKQGDPQAPSHKTDRGEIHGSDQQTGDQKSDSKGEPQTPSHQPDPNADMKSSDQRQGDPETSAHQPGSRGGVSQSPGAATSGGTDSVGTLASAAGAPAVVTNAGGSGGGVGSGGGLSGLVGSIGQGSPATSAAGGPVSGGVPGGSAGRVPGVGSSAGLPGAAAPASTSGTAGGVGGGSGGVPRFVPPAVSAPAVPVVPEAAPPPPVVPQLPPAAPSAAASPTAGAFGAGATSSVPVQSIPAQVAGSGSAAAGGVAVPMGAGAATVPPPPQVVGAAPASSPGLSQGSVGGPAAGGVDRMAAASPPPGVGMVPAEFRTAAEPATVDRHAQLAIDTVKALAPGMARVAGLIVAAAVVRVPGDVPRVVIMTNDGEGYLPQGCYLPRSVKHAVEDLAYEFGDGVANEFGAKWFGWADPARALIDYVVTSEQRGVGMELLGLAAIGRVSAATKNLFPRAVSAFCDVGTQPLPAAGNQHRLQVVWPALYVQLQQASDFVRHRAASRAVTAALAHPHGGLTQARAIWERMRTNAPVLPEAWAALREDYEQGVRLLGARRPGLMELDAPGDSYNRRAADAYVQDYLMRRAQEALLGVEAYPDICVEDIVYAAHAAGADLKRMMLDR